MIAAGVGAATTIAAIATRPSAPKPETISAPQTAVETAKYQDAAAQAQAQALLKRRGMAATILTSPMGLTPSSNGQKSTLGG